MCNLKAGSLATLLYVTSLSTLTTKSTLLPSSGGAAVTAATVTQVAAGRLACGATYATRGARLVSQAYNGNRKEPGIAVGNQQLAYAQCNCTLIIFATPTTPCGDLRWQLVSCVWAKIPSNVCMPYLAQCNRGPLLKGVVVCVSLFAWGHCGSCVVGRMTLSAIKLEESSGICYQLYISSYCLWGIRQASYVI